ncbi:Transposon Tf2-6 polyprotein [Araneus ventricosus]|uniref:RNA-directed DNA polymerase n=1 Tax=Araneus ventricosus TaxID=182803 RepID=A0A4Y2CN89_ARAVE|nr:Transposon Tf2-6 polyprotein [Araneus ventricosus]
MLNLITPQYYWPNITSDITEFVKHCSVCQLNKKRKQKRFGLLQQVPPTSTPFECISVDTVGGFNYYNSTKKFLHIVIDHATRHVWAFPSKNENSETYINILKQIFQIQVPVKLLTDRNAAFTSSRFKKFLRNYNVKHLLTTAHHPQTNGKVERVNQSLVTRLKCKVNSTSTKVPWTKLLESVTNEYNLTPHSITKYPPAYLLLGTLPYDSPIGQNSYYEPVNEAHNLALQRTIDYHNKNKIRYDARFVDKKFNPGDLVVYEEFHYPNTRKLTPPFSGPYEVIKQCSEYLRISHGDDVRLRCDDDREEERIGNDRERDRDRDRDRKRRRSCSPEQPRGPPPKRTCLLGSPPRHIREAEETKRWQEEMKMLQQQQPGFEIRLSPDPEEGSSAHFKPNFYQETLLNSPSPKKRPPNPETSNSFHVNTSNSYPRESPSKVYIYDDDEFIEIDLPPPPPTKQEPPEEFHWDNVRSMTRHEENHIKPFHENSQQDLDFTSDVKFDETTQFSEMESSTDCPPNLSPSQTSIHDFKDNDEASSQGLAKIKEEKFSDEETNASSQEAPAPPIVIPSHLPPKQRELLKRVLHNNQKKKTASDAPGSPNANEGTDIEIKKEESDVEEKVESQSKDYKWYSSEDDDDDDDTVQPLTAVLKRIQQDPPSKPIVQETKPSLKLLDMFEHIQRKGKSQESSNGQAQQQKQSQNQFWENLFGGKPPSLPLPVTNSNNPPPSEPKRRTLLPDPILPPAKVELMAPKESVEIKDPRLKNRDPRKLANMPVPAPKVATFDQKNDPVTAPSVLAQNAIIVKSIPAVSSDPSKESIPYKLRGISAKPPNYTPLIHASQSNPNLLKDPRLRKHLNPNTNSDVIGNGKDPVITKPPVQSKSIPPIPELLLKYEPLKAINIFETSSSKPAVKAEEPKSPVVYDPRRIRRDSRSNSGSDTPPHLTIVDTVPEEKPAPVLENEKEFVEEKKWLPPVLERSWAPPVLERNWASIVEKTEEKTEIDGEPSLKLETSGKSPPKKSPSSPPPTKEEFITVIKKEPTPVATSNTHPIVPPLIIKKVKPTPPASHLPRAIADPRMARLHDRNSRSLVSSDTNSKSFVERKKLTTPAEPTKTTVNAAADSSNSSEMPESVNLTESQKASAEEASDKASKEEELKSAKSIPKKRRLSDKSDEKKKTVHRNRKSSMDYASPLNSCDASKDSKSLGYNSYNQRPKRTVPPHNERMSPNSGVSSSLMEMSDNSMPEFVLSDSSNLECDNSSDVNLRDRFKTIDPTASPFC